MSGQQEKYTVAEEAEGIVRDVVNRVFMPEQTYDHARVAETVNSIVDGCVAKLQQSKLPRKYIAHCTIVQKTGAGMHTAAACQWNADSDGSYVYKVETKGMICIVTIFGVTM
jgi:dynein light chain Tctex-type 1